MNSTKLRRIYGRGARYVEDTISHGGDEGSLHRRVSTGYSVNVEILQDRLTLDGYIENPLTRRRKEHFSKIERDLISPVWHWDLRRQGCSVAPGLQQLGLGSSGNIVDKGLRSSAQKNRLS